MNIQPETCSRSAWQPNWVDYTQAPLAFAAAKHFAIRFFGLNPEGLKFSGYSAETRGSLHVVLYSGGVVYREFHQKCDFAGDLYIEAGSKDPKDAITRDVMGDFQSAWLTAMGYTADFPCGVECQVSGDSLDIQITPCN